MTTSEAGPAEESLMEIAQRVGIVLDQVSSVHDGALVAVRNTPQ